MLSEENIHEPVLFLEVMECFRQGEIQQKESSTESLTKTVLPRQEKNYRFYLDCTLGAGGHSEGLLTEHEDVFLIGIDRDRTALERCRLRLMRFSDRMLLFHGNFHDLLSLVHQFLTVLATDYGILKHQERLQFHGILVDLGLSSDQLNDPQRGFSFQKTGPLDMRMNQKDSKTAAELVNQLSFPALRSLFVRAGVGRASNELAQEVFKHRPLATTTDLALLCEKVIPKYKRGYKHSRNASGVQQSFTRASSHHPATVPFQALRIAINEEFEALESFLGCVTDMLIPGGRLAVICFHSIEDRMVTRAMRLWTRGVVDEPRGLPSRSKNHFSLGKLLTKAAITPREDEIKTNPRARSARMRVFEKAN